MSSGTEELGPTGQPISFFSILKSIAGQLTLGTDITRIALPSIFCYPLSLLEIMAIKRMRGMDQLTEINNAEDPLLRILLVMRWFYSSLTPDEFGKKPLNPILGETFECKSGDTYYLAEQVSHHPPISAFFFEHIPTGITYYGHAQVIAKFGGNSVAADFAGDAYLYVPKHGELYQFSYPMPTMHARGLLIGKSRNELGGEMWLECEKSGYRANFTFKTTGMFSGTENEVVGKVKHSSEKKKHAASWSGLWNTEVELSLQDKSASHILEYPAFKGNVLFRFSDVAPAPLEPIVREGSRDSRSVWGETMAAIRAGDLAKADEEKAKVENEQRARLRAKKEETGDENGGFVPVHFDKDENGVWHIKETSRPSVNTAPLAAPTATATATASGDGGDDTTTASTSTSSS